MALISIDVTKKPVVIEIGVQGENVAEGAAFDITPWVTEYGLGTAYIYNQRKNDSQPYFKELPITLADSVYTATWTFDKVDSKVDGEGTCQLIYVNGETVKKTSKYVTTTGKSLGEATGDIPDPYEDLLEEARAIYQNMIARRQEAVAAAGSAAASANYAAGSASDAADSAAAAAESAALAASVYAQAGNVTFIVKPDGSVREVWTKEE